MIINGLDYRFKEARVILNLPTPDLIQLFFMVDNGVMPDKRVDITNEDAAIFYDNWTTHRQVYEKLCDSLGSDYSVIPEDIENEV